MDNGDGGYPRRLRAAIERANTSRNKLAPLLADQTGTKTSSAYRAIGKYLAGQEEPSPERAAALAVLLNAPDLALVSPVPDRRRGRQAKLEGAVDRLVADVLRLADRVEALERRAAPRSSRARKT